MDCPWVPAFAAILLVLSAPLHGTMRAPPGRVNASAPISSAIGAAAGLTQPASSVAPLVLPASVQGLAQAPSATAGVAHAASDLAAAQIHTGQEAARLLALRPAGVETSAVLASNDTKTIIEYKGIPSRVEELNTSGKTFRHWTRSEEALGSILHSGKLVAGPVSYVEFTGSQRAYIKQIFLDLGGVFFTTPEHSSAEPRVMNEALNHYVDFKLPEGIAALSLDGNEVLMIPAKGLGAAGVPIQIVGSSLERGPAAK